MQPKPLRRERKAGQAVGERAIAVQIAAGGEVALQGRGPLPHLAPALPKPVVVRTQGRVRNRPKALAQQNEQQERRDSLGRADVETTPTHLFRVQGSEGEERRRK